MREEVRGKREEVRGKREEGNATSNLFPRTSSFIFCILSSSIEACRAGPGGPARVKPVAPGCVLLGESDHEDQRRECADSDPDPLLTSETGRLKLIEVLCELVQVVRRELGEALLDFF